MHRIVSLLRNSKGRSLVKYTLLLLVVVLAGSALALTLVLCASHVARTPAREVGWLRQGADVFFRVRAPDFQSHGNIFDVALGSSVYPTLHPLDRHLAAASGRLEGDSHAGQQSAEESRHWIRACIRAAITNW